LIPRAGEMLQLRQTFSFRVPPLGFRRTVR
jgi:hypothetical protein